METNINTNTVVTVATFAISMRAASLIEDLAAAGIKAVMAQPKWINKKLPPPRVEVWVAAKDADAAKVVVEQFKRVG